LERLEEESLADNTLVIIIGDKGSSSKNLPS